MGSSFDFPTSQSEEEEEDLRFLPVHICLSAEYDRAINRVRIRLILILEEETGGLILLLLNEYLQIVCNLEPVGPMPVIVSGNATKDAT